MKWNVLPILIFIFLESCISEQGVRENLDIVVPEIKAADSVAKQKGDPESLSPQELFNWRSYYMLAPGQAEKAELQKQLNGVPEDNDFASRLKRARNLSAIGQHNEARELYISLLRERSDDLDLLIELSHIFLAENDTERAFDYITSMKHQLDKIERPKDEYIFRYRYVLALAYAQSQNDKKAREILVDIIGRQSGFIPAYVTLAESYLQHGKTELAEFIAKRGLDRNIDDPRLQNILVVISLRERHYEEARVWLEKILARNPEYVPGLVNRAHLAIKRREYIAAENDLQRCVTLEPRNVDAQIALGMLYRKTGQLSASKVALERAISIDPQNIYARYQLGILLSEDFKDAANAMQLFYDVLQAREDDGAIKNLAKIRIQSIRDSRLYEN